MKTSLNVIKRWDKKILSSARERYLQSTNRALKPHSGITVLAIFAIYLFSDFLSGIKFEHESYHDLVIVFKVLLALIFVILCIFSFYYWRVFFNLRREGINTDNNLFFAESAGLYRKIFFYASTVFWLIRTIHSHIYPVYIEQEMKRLKYQLRSDYYYDVGLTVLDNFIFSILFVELLRILLPRTYSWNNKKHIAVVVLMSFVLSAFRLLALSFAGGH